MRKTELHFVFGGGDWAFRPVAFSLAHRMPARIKVQSPLVHAWGTDFQADVPRLLQRAALTFRRCERLKGYAQRNASRAARAHRAKIHRAESPPTAHEHFVERGGRDLENNAVI